MSTKIKIPKGWRRIRRGTIIQRTDKWLMDDAPAIWRQTHNAGHLVNLAIYIRRIPKKRKKA